MKDSMNELQEGLAVHLDSLENICSTSFMDPILTSTIGSLSYPGRNLTSIWFSPSSTSTSSGNDANAALTRPDLPPIVGQVLTYMLVGASQEPTQMSQLNYPNLI